MVKSGLDVHAFQPMGDWGLKATQQVILWARYL
jgi:hypothetical protein